MNEEREVAEKNGYESPVHDSLEETHMGYNYCMTEFIESLSKNCLLIVASHNIGSVQLAQAKIMEHIITDHRVRFG